MWQCFGFAENSYHDDRNTHAVVLKLIYLSTGVIGVGKSNLELCTVQIFIDQNKPII